MRPASLLFLSILLLFSPLNVQGEALVEGVAAIITFNPGDTRRAPVREVLFFSDVARYRLFFDSRKAGTEEKTQNGRAGGHGLWLECLNDVIGQKLLEPEAARFVFKKPTDKEVEAHLLLIRQRFENEAAFQNALLQTGFLLAELKEETHKFLWVQSLIKERISEFIFVSPKEIVAYYLEHLKAYAGKPFEAIEKNIEGILAKEKERIKKTDYIHRLKEKVKIEMILKETSLNSSLNGA